MSQIIQENKIKSLLEAQTEGASSWEDFKTIWHSAQGLADISKWLKGKLADMITVKYGEDSLGKFAIEVGVDKSTMENYRRTYRAFQEIDPTKRNLTYTHYQVASYADSYDRSEEKFKSEERHNWLEKAEDENWSVKRLAAEIKKKKQVEEEGKTHFELALEYLKKVEYTLLRWENLSEKQKRHIATTLEGIGVKLTAIQGDSV